MLTLVMTSYLHLDSIHSHGIDKFCELDEQAATRPVRFASVVPEPDLFDICEGAMPDELKLFGGGLEDLKDKEAVRTGRSVADRPAVDSSFGRKDAAPGSVEDGKARFTIQRHWSDLIATGMKTVEARVVVSRASRIQE